MVRNFKELRKKMSPERQARSAARAAKIMEGMALADLRRARRLSQETLAEAMHVSQPEVSKLEKRADTYVSTVRKYVEALGGSLEIIAHFPEGEVRITQFGALEEADG
jgi:transcriptional regulator with XRE-family HTH domain